MGKNECKLEPTADTISLASDISSFAGYTPSLTGTLDSIGDSQHEIVQELESLRSMLAAKSASTEAPVPWPGSAFAIRHIGSGHFIGLDDGGNVRLKAVENVGARESCHWRCHEKDGWFGFRHEGRFLGHSGEKDMHAESKHHKEWESYCIRKHPEGGYQIMSPRSKTFWYLGVDKSGQKVVRVEHGNDVRATTWDFTKV